MMEQKLKERLVGAAVLVAVAVIFIPIILNDSPETEVITGSNIPEKPETDFNSRIVPVIESNKVPDNDGVSSPRNDGNKADTGVNEDNNEQANAQEIIVEQVKSADENYFESSPVKKDIITEGNVGLTAWIVQLGSFTSEDNAQSLNKRLRKEGYPAFVEPLKKNGKISYRVRVGPEIKRSDAESLLKKLKDKMDLDGIIVSYP